MEPARRWPGIVLYPSAPSYIANPKMMVMSYGVDPTLTRKLLEFP
jgi:hypothetical protein